MGARRIALTAWLLLFGASLAVGDDTPLADAAEQQDATAMRALLDAGADVQAAQQDGMTALHWAAYHDDVSAAKLLVKAGADAGAETRYGVQPLSLACLNGNAEMVKLLLEAGADPEATLAGGETALMTASRTGRPGAVQALLARGADVNAKDRRGQTALMWAAADGHREVVDLHLAAGADFRTPLASGFTPLLFAVREGRTGVALRLLDAGLDVNDALQSSGRKKGPNPLLLAVENAHFQTAVALLEAGADPNAQPEGHGALHAISWVRKPIRGDGNPPPVGSGNVSALDFVRAMAAHGADVNLRLAAGESGFADFTTTGATPLVLAARTGDLPLLNVLLELGADPSITNSDSSTALLAAAGIGDLGSGQEAAGSEAEAIETIKLLLELGLDVNAVDENGETAIHGAAYQNWPKLIQFLVASGADVSVWNRRNRWGWTPLLIAQGYREGNFRPDPATSAAIESAMRAAGVTPPAPRSDVVANQQSWDKKKAVADKKPKPAAAKNTARSEPSTDPPAMPTP